MRAVDSENKKNLNNDHWRLNQLEKHLSNPSHVYHKFGTGNLETLNVPGIRDILIEFHDRYYSANLMKLVVYGRESLDELQGWVEELFSSVKNCEVKRPEWPGQPWNLNDSSRDVLIEARTLKEMRSMTVTWLISDQRSHYLTKPEQYLTHLLGHEGSGSLFQALKVRGWLTSLSAGCDNDAHGYNFFQISIDLSPQGWESYEEVLKWIVRYVSLLRMWGPNAEVFEECRQLASMAFKFREKGDPSTFTHQLAAWAHKFEDDPRFMLAGTFLIEQFDASCIDVLVKELTCDRMRVTRASSNGVFSQSHVEILKEPWYGTEYQLTQLSPTLMQELRTIEQSTSDTFTGELFLPKRNVFIPERFTVPISPGVETPLKAPKKLASPSSRMALWHKLDDTFEQPKSQLSLFFRTPLVSVTPLKAQRALLFKDLLKHTLVLYDATLAGLHYDFVVLAEGFEVRLTGFSDKLGVLLEECLKALTERSTLQFNEIDFEVVRDRQLRSLQNFPREAPYWHASYHLNSLLTDPVNSIESRICALQAMNTQSELSNFNDPNFFINEIFPSSVGRIDMLLHGSIEEPEALALASLVSKYFNNNPCDIVESNTSDTINQSIPTNTSSSTMIDWKQRIVKFDRPCDLYFVPPTSTGLDNPNSAVEVFFPIGRLDKVRLRTLSALFVQIFNEPFFDTLRTTEQLGYLVTHGLREKGTLVGLRFLIQSERNPLHLDARIEAFIADNVPRVLAAMTPEEFKLHCTALKADLTQKKKTLAGESKMHWEAILSGSNDFLRPWIDAEELDSLKLQDLTDFYNSFLLKSSPNRSRATVHIWAQCALNASSTDANNDNKSTLIDQLYQEKKSSSPNVRIIQHDRDQFVQSMELYPSIYNCPTRNN